MLELLFWSAIAYLVGFFLFRGEDKMMFLEFHSPKVIDDISTRDRIKLRFGETKAGPNLWVCLVFETKDEALDFFARAMKTLEKTNDSRNT